MKGVAIDDVAAYLNETALFRNQWQFRPEAGETDEEFRNRLRPVLREQLARARTDDLLIPQVVYGYYPVNGDGNDLIVWTDEARANRTDAVRFPPPATGPVALHRRLLPARR